MLSNKQWTLIFVIGLIACVILIALGVGVVYSLIMGFGITTMVIIAVTLMKNKRD